jgi:uncharacterized membrane protein
MLKNILLRGLFFVVPISIAAIILGKLFALSMQVAIAMDGYIPADRIAGIALSNILAILVVFLIVFLAGLVSYIAIINDKVVAFERILSLNMPGYSLIKGMMGNPEATQDVVGNIKSVLVSLGPAERIGFEIERFDNKVIVFLPDQPSIIKGTSVIVTNDQVRLLDIPPRQLYGLLQVHGRGMGKLLSLSNAE